ncbi:SDR family NAD(P)-dependent oxidoreductase [Amycolatopsis speibonae]|uniref:SDR family NAD(P)-dependent oxidoreductase n=1 Tax=Amycolatopsis speibonae TaxID=1450224 RepID=A0ABV7PAY1_9PSEU
MSSLAGKAALVTGGSRGIGAATVLRLARDGADVAFTFTVSRDQADALAEQVRKLGRTAVPLQADSNDLEQVRSAVDDAAAELGRLDILVNSVAVMIPGGTFDSLSVADIDRTFNLNVRAVFLTIQQALRYLPEGGRIIILGSNIAEYTPFPGMALYASSKSALHGLTRGLARELGPRGINAVLVQPGPTDTDANPADGPKAQRMRDLIPLGRYGHPDDIAAMIAHLAGDGGRHITGTTITIDGGFNT